MNLDLYNTEISSKPLNYSAEPVFHEASSARRSTTHCTPTFGEASIGEFAGMTGLGFSSILSHMKLQTTVRRRLLHQQ